MGILFANGVNMTLAGNLGATDTSFAVTAGQGSQCPAIAADSTDYMLLCITNKNGLREIVKIIEHLSGSDTFTIGDSTAVPHVAAVGGRAFEATVDGYQTALAITASDSHKITMPITAAMVTEAMAFSAVTASVAEINGVCDGCTATAAEIVAAIAYHKGLTLTEAEVNALIDNVPPVGSIISYSPGYFADGANGTFTHQMVSANTIAAVNTLLNPKGWYVCDGAALNDADSGIFNGASRYLPNLTDDRFLMGDTVAGGIGGANSSNLAHTHTTGSHSLTTSEMPSHSHRMSGALTGAGTIGVTNAVGTASSSFTTEATGSGATHNHGATGSGGSAAQENRPTYLSCLYIMRVH